MSQLAPRSFRFLTTPQGKVIGLELYGMQYLPYTEYYKHGDKVECIPAGDSLNRTLQRVLDTAVNRTELLLSLEKVAFKAIESYFTVLIREHTKCTLPSMSRAMKAVSLPRGSVVLISNTGEVGNLVCKDPRDILTLNRELKKFPHNKCITEVGAPLWAILEKLDFKVDDVAGGFATLSRTNAGTYTNVSQMQGVTIWQNSTHSF